MVVFQLRTAWLCVIALLLAIHAEAATEDGFVLRVPRPEEVAAVRPVSGNAVYRFDPLKTTRSSTFFSQMKNGGEVGQKPGEGRAGDDREGGGDGGRMNGPEGGPGGRAPGAMALLQKLPMLKTALDLREQVMDKITAVGNNPKRRLVFPFYWFDKQNDQKPRGETKPEEGQKTKDDRNQGTSEKKSGMQEKYWLGYRLGTLGERKPEEWFLGFGWKSAEGGGGRGMKEQERDPEQPVKKEFGGPIIGLIGYF